MQSMWRPFAMTALPLALAACGTMNPTGTSGTTAQPGEIPAAIAAPSGARLALTLKGSGLQNYECRSVTSASGGYDWVLVSPEAALRDANGTLVGKHYGGPSWEYGDGSKVTGKVVATAPAPQAGNIPWVLLQGTSATTPGMLAGVTYVQRTNTSGGTSPSDSCVASTIGSKKAVRYTADYLFYKG